MSGDVRKCQEMSGNVRKCQEKSENVKRRQILHPFKTVFWASTVSERSERADFGDTKLFEIGQCLEMHRKCQEMSDVRKCQKRRKAWEPWPSWYLPYVVVICSSM